MTRPTLLTVLQGSTWSQSWDVDYTTDTIPGWPTGPLPATWTVRAQVRDSIPDPTVLARWDSTDATTLPCSNNGTGTVTLEISAATSSAWAWRKGKWDLEVVSPDGAQVVRVDWGTIVVKPEVTREVVAP